MEAKISMLPVSSSLRKFKILESASQFMIIASDKFEEQFHVIRIDKKADVESLSFTLEDIIIEEIQVFTKQSLEQYLQELRETVGSKIGQTRQTIKKEQVNFQEYSKCKKACGILGFVKFLKGYYLIMITQKKKIAQIGHHKIYQLKDMHMIQLFKWVSNMRKKDEEKYIDLFKQIKISEGFFFSYTYDLTHTLQNNICKQIKKKSDEKEHQESNKGSQYEEAEESSDSEDEANTNYMINRSQSSMTSNSKEQSLTEEERLKRESMHQQFQQMGLQEKWLKEHSPFESHFFWNHYLIKDFYRILKKKKWVMPVIYGDISQLNFKSETQNCTYILIARRSRRYAGTRYLKRGINEHGNVANFVEVEQICYINSDHFDLQPLITSFVQIRGSIPLFWFQKPNPIKPKPDIVLQQDQDPQYKATKRHFAQLMARFSHPIYCFNLTKKNNQREKIVALEYKHAVTERINSQLPKQLKIKFIHYDVKAKKKEERNFPLGLFSLTKQAIMDVGIFSVDSKKSNMSTINIQRGVIRSNCIDSLDRTNFAQEMFGYTAMLLQLKKLRVIDKMEIQMRSQFFNLIFEMYNKMGDAISIQYGGSVAHRAGVSGGKKKFMQGLGEVGTSISRHLQNSFSDTGKQRVLNLFLGIYNPLNNPTTIWDIDDHELHLKVNKVIKLSQIQGDKWWASYIQDHENTLPRELKKDLTDILTRNPDSDSDDQGIKQHIQKNLELFQNDQNYIMNKNGIFCQNGDISKVHPLQINSVHKKYRKSMQMADQFEMNLRMNANLDEFGNIENLLFQGRQQRYKATKYRSTSSKKLREFNQGDHEIGRSNRSYDGSLKNILQHHSHHFLQKCQLNIYSDDSSDQGEDPHFAVYKTKKMTYLEKKIKDDFNQFMPVKFENEKEDDLQIEEDQAIKMENLKKELMQMLNDQEVSKLNDGPVMPQNEFKDYYEKFERLYQDFKMSYQLKKIPKDLLPSTEKGNYSLRINENKHGYTHTRDVRHVNNWVSYHKRDHQIASNILMNDLAVLDDYINFDFSSIHSIKIKNQVDQFVNEKFDSLAHEDLDIMRYPNFQELRQGLKDQSHYNKLYQEKNVVEQYSSSIQRYKEIMFQAYNASSDKKESLAQSQIIDKYAHLDCFQNPRFFSTSENQQRSFRNSVRDFQEEMA